MKTYSDSTLKAWSKEQLIEYIRMLEHNYIVAIEYNENQAKNFAKILSDLRELDNK